MTDSAKKNLDDFWVPWGDIPPETIAKFRETLENAPGEAELQVFLEDNPGFLCQHLPAARGYWVIPTKRLGSEHVTDFLIGENTPHQPTWHAVELERPQASLFTQRGDPTAALTHAMRQIDDWRTWLSHNRDYAARAAEWSGLGLGDIDPELDGLVIIGRAASLGATVEERRRRLSRQNRMRIETYDWLISQAEDRARPPDARSSLFDWLFSPIKDEFASMRAERAIKAVFGTAHSASALGTIRSTDYEFLVLRDKEATDDDDDWKTSGREVIYHEVRDSRINSGAQLDVADWRDWLNSPEMDFVNSVEYGKEVTLLVTEIEPTPDLRDSLTSLGAGLWAEEHRWKEEPPYATHVLLHLPLELPFEEKVARCTAAKTLITERKFAKEGRSPIERMLLQRQVHADDQEGGS